MLIILLLHKETKKERLPGFANIKEIADTNLTIPWRVEGCINLHTAVMDCSPCPSEFVYSVACI